MVCAVVSRGLRQRAARAGAGSVGGARAGRVRRGPGAGPGQSVTDERAALLSTRKEAGERLHVYMSGV